MNDVLLMVVAALTLLVGVVLGVMVWRRRRSDEAAEEASEEPASARSTAGSPTERPWRPIDDFAIPVDFEGEAPIAEEEDDFALAGKICPRCGTRYRSHSRVCAHDQSELASLN